MTQSKIVKTRWMLGWLAVAALIGGAMILSGCGGSGKTPPPPTGGFSVASLKGQYGFSMSGLDLSGAYLARAGSFAADGNGKITAALEDVVDLGATPTASTVAFTGGTYDIQPNGRGVMILQNPNGGGLQLNFILNSTSQGELLQTDLNAAASWRIQSSNAGELHRGRDKRELRVRSVGRFFFFDEHGGADYHDRAGGCGRKWKYHQRNN